MQEECLQYWFNTQTKSVEVGKQSLAVYRLGPFLTKQEAERAPQIIAERAAAWRAEDEQAEKG